MQDGRVVKGIRFQDLADQGDPVALATRYEQEGADEIVFLDISASHEGRTTMLDTVRRTAEALFIPLTVGGGVGSLADVHRVLRAGADKVAINTAAIRDAGLVNTASAEFGAQCIVVALDARRQAQGWGLYTHGGRNATGIDAVDWARRMGEAGAGELLVTSMDRDGTGEGFDLRLTAACREASNVPTIASGGAGRVEHFTQALQVTDAALGAGLFHRGALSVRDVKAHALAHGVAVRP